MIGPWLDRIARRMNRLALAELKIGPRDSVLEIGFGGGGLIELLLARTAGEVVGADVSEAMLSRGRRRFRREIVCGRLRLIKASIEVLPLADASVDRAVSVNNIYFWPDPVVGLAELARVLRPGGRLSIAFEPPEELGEWARHGFRLFGEAELAELMRAAGFGGIERAEGRGRKPDRFLCLSGTRLDANQ